MSDEKSFEEKRFEAVQKLRATVALLLEWEIFSKRDALIMAKALNSVLEGTEHVS